MANLSDRNAVFLRRFGTVALLQRKTDSTVEPFVGVFSAASHDNTIQLANGALGQMLTVSSPDPWIWVSLDLARLDSAWSGAAPVQGDSVTIGVTVYRVHDPQPDGQGGMKLVLKRQ